MGKSIERGDRETACQEANLGKTIIRKTSKSVRNVLTLQPQQPRLQWRWVRWRLLQGSRTPGPHLPKSNGFETFLKYMILTKLLSHGRKEKFNLWLWRASPWKREAVSSPCGQDHGGLVVDFHFRPLPLLVWRKCTIFILEGFRQNKELSGENTLLEFNGTLIQRSQGQEEQPWWLWRGGWWGQGAEGRRWRWPCPARGPCSLSPACSPSLPSPFEW